MPALGESVSEGTVTRWLKSEGDMVAVDEPLLEVSTDKVDTEIPSPVAGVLSKIVVGVDQTVAVGAELAVISSASEGGINANAAGVPLQLVQSLPLSHRRPKAVSMQMRQGFLLKLRLRLQSPSRRFR